MKQLKEKLQKIDGRGYPNYKSIKGIYDFENFELSIDHVQGDPFAAPTKISLNIPVSLLNLNSEDIGHPSRRIGLEDGIHRSFHNAQKRVGKSRGSGKSGQWNMLAPGQEIILQTATELTQKTLKVRMTLGLPAAGRKILAREAEAMLTRELLQMVERGIFKADRKNWIEHAKAAEDQDHLRHRLKEKGWLAFVANGTILPRASGIEDRPMQNGAIAWTSPGELLQEIELPHQGRIQGTAIPEGVTLICGGGYHGKSTLLEALSRGIYNHIPGDGRELCVSRYEAVAVRAEDGRSVSGVDISPFINNLPNEGDTKSFDSQNASGSTSQAANISEALELGAECLLIDEDTSATNFMVRDRRMQALIATEQEPITPFIDRVRELYDYHKVSTILVIGGAGDYFNISDHVLVMRDYYPSVETQRAKKIAKEYPANRLQEPREPLKLPPKRIPLKKSFNISSSQKPLKIKTQGTRAIMLEKEEIEVSQLEQLFNEGQSKTIGDWLKQIAKNLNDGEADLQELAKRMETEAMRTQLSQTLEEKSGDHVFTRRFELASALNRLRTLKTTTRK